MTANRGQYRKTCRRYNTPGQAHFLTFSCFRRQAFLNGDRARRWFIDALAAARSVHAFDLWAYVLMPEHVHLVLYPRRDEYAIGDILSDVKQPATRAALRFVRQHAPDFLVRMRDAQPNGKAAHRFWQRGGGYDRNLITPEEICEKINYLHENPVRRGLVLRPQDWLWSSARYYAERMDGVLKPDVESLPEIRISHGKACPR